MIKKGCCIVALYFSSIYLSYADNDLMYWKEFSAATAYMKENKFNEALIILERLERVQNNYNVELALGDSYFALGFSEQAFIAYSAALKNGKKAQNKVIERVALFKMARSALMLKKYQEALNLYQTLLALGLHEVDEKVAKEGLLNAQTHLLKPTGKQQIMLGDQAAIKENPSQALYYYKKAYEEASNAHNATMQRVAIFKMAKMHIWLNNFDTAITLYNTLLSMPMSQKDKEVAITALKNTRAMRLNHLLDRARHLIDKNQGQKAYELVEPHLNEKLFSVMLIAAQSLAILNKSKQSFDYFKKSYSLSRSAAEKKIALIGMIKMQLQLKNAVLVDYYLLKLSKFALSPNDLILKQKFFVQLRALKIELLIQRAKKFIAMNNSQQAYDLIKPHLTKENNATLYLLAAQSQAILNQPRKALFLYKTSLLMSKNQQETTAALFGIAKMEFWLSRYVASGKIYMQLLARNLASAEYELALAGVVKSLAYYDRPRAALKKIPSGYIFHSPQMVIAASQASLWAGWPYLAENIISKYQGVLKNLTQSLEGDLKDLKWQTELATWPNVLTPSLYASADSETFRKKQVLFNYSHNWNSEAQTSLGSDYIHYSQYQSYKLEAKGVYLRHKVQPLQYVKFEGQIEPIEYKNLTSVYPSHWHPLLWRFSGNFIPNDYWSLLLSANKEVIETFPAFANQISDNQYAATLNLNPIPYIVFNGSRSQLNMSDGNVRNGYFTSASFLISPNYGITTVAILRGFSNKFRSPNYFSPHLYREQKILLKIGRKFRSTWHYYLDGGLGRQYITATPEAETFSSPTYQWGMGVNGPISRFLSVNLYYANIHQASSFINSPDYSYQYGALSFNILV